jgi:Asp-tRNA(Asn)/Glu-tRNA(Gln) amidotransferase A subunit family amidase
VQRLKAAGALVLAKTVTTEFAFADPGPTANPRDLTRTPGGSSSGSAAAVAAGYAPAALGSQTVDSVVNPAAYCGVVGFKPSYGRVPIDGVLALSPSMDHVGWLSSDVAGAALLGSVLCDGWDSSGIARSPRIGVPVGRYLDQTEPESLEQFWLQIAALEDGGLEVRRIPALDDIAVIAASHRALIAAEFVQEHSDRFRDYGARYHAKSLALFAEGSALPPASIADGLRSSERVSGSLVAAMDAHSIDLWAAPAATGPAPRGLDYIGDPAMSVPWTHAHLPAITVPAGRAEGMPLGLQLIGRPGADEYVLAAAEPVQQRL